jgi:transposase
MKKLKMILLKMTFPTPAKYKKRISVLKEIDSLALANAQLNLDKAYKNFFFFGINPLDFHVSKSKKNPVQSYTTNNQNGTVALIDSKFIKVPKLKSLVRIKLHRQPKKGLSNPLQYHVILAVNTIFLCCVKKKLSNYLKLIPQLVLT